MSLPKRDGVHGRYYLIHKPDTDPEVLVEADLCIQDVLSGAARENHAAYPTVVRNHNGTPFLPKSAAGAASFPAAAEGISLRGCGFHLRRHAAAGGLGRDPL